MHFRCFLTFLCLSMLFYALYMVVSMLLCCFLQWFWANGVLGCLEDFPFGLMEIGHWPLVFLGCKIATVDSIISKRWLFGD